MMNAALLNNALRVIVSNPEIVRALTDELDMPNIRSETLGGEIWWRDLANAGGWRVQQNSVTKHCRVLDPHNVRYAWGGEKAMTRLFEKMVG